MYIIGTKKLILLDKNISKANNMLAFILFPHLKTDYY